MKISVITASYNYENYIARAIESVLAQTFCDFELIVVDDGSTDNSLEIIKSYCEKDPRVKLFTHENHENKGLKETLLLGLEKAQGEWVAFLESDDVFKPENLMKKIEIIQKNPSVSLIFNKVDFDWDKKRSKRKQRDFENTQKKLSKKKFPRNMFFDFFINNQILTFSAVMVKKEVIKNADFSTPVDALLDWWLWVHLAYKNEFYYLDEALTLWNLHSESYTLNYPKQKFIPLQVFAYLDVYNKDKNLKLLAFIFYSSFRLLFVKAYRFSKKVFKKLLRMALNLKND